MKYINQLEHRDIPYEHNLDHGGVPEEKRNVAAGRLRSELSVHDGGCADSVNL